MRLLVIDDDPLIVIALTTILEQEEDITVVATGHSYEDAVRLYEEHRPDLCLFDIRMGEKTGIDAARTIKEAHKGAPILFLTTFLDDTYISDALQIGSRGYILKQDFTTIVPSVRAAHAGQTVFGADVMQKIPSLDASAPRWDEYDLTDKEQEVFALVAEGYSNREIAKSLYLSEGTVRNYISRLLEKLNLRDRTQLAIRYLKG